MPTRSLDQEFAAGKIKVLTREVWDQILRTIELRIKRHDNREQIVDNAIADLLDVGLSRIDEVLSPAIEKIGKVAELGFLVARSATPHVLPAAPGDTMLWTITAGDQRDLFQPAPFCVVQSNEDPDTWALIKSANFIRENGALYGEVWFVGPDADTETTFDDWSIGALAGSTTAQMALLTLGQAAASSAAADRLTVASDKGIVSGYKQAVADDKQAVAFDKENVSENKALAQGYKDTAQEAAQTAVNAANSIAGGPVANVAGLTGIVTKDALNAALGTEAAMAAATRRARGFTIAMAMYF